MTVYTHTELHECAAREVKQRKRVYAYRIRQGQMTEAFAKQQIGMMQAIADHFEELAQKEKLL